MKAAVIHEFGGVDVLKYEDIETPKSKPSHVLIKVLAAGVNRLAITSAKARSFPSFPSPTSSAPTP